MGASGDLAPLSHLALGLMGEGKMWSPKSGWADAKYVRSEQLFHGFKTINLLNAPGNVPFACESERLQCSIEKHVCFLMTLDLLHVFLSFHLWPGPGSPWTEANITKA